MKGTTIAARAKRRLELKARKSIPLNPQIFSWMPATPANIEWLEAEVWRSRLPGRTPWEVIEERKGGKKTGRIALVRVK